MIVKIQIPLVEDHPDESPAQRAMVRAFDAAGVEPDHTLAYIYSKDRYIDTHVPVLDVMRLFKPGEVKIYCKAKLVKKQLKIIKRVGAQNW